MYDVLIIGGGPAGVTAGIYTATGGLSTALFEKAFVGGQISIASEVKNYPGFRDPITGADFAIELEQQATNLGVEIIYGSVSQIDVSGDVKKLTVGDKTYEGKTVIIASGANFKKLGLPSEEKFIGRGVSYCATCDGNFFKEKPVAMIGGGNHAVGEAIYLARICSKVTLVYRGDELKANANLIKRAMDNPKIELIMNSDLQEIQGDTHVEGIKIKNSNSGEETIIPVSAVFVAIGRSPDIGYLDPKCLDDNGYIHTDDDMKVEPLKGVYAAGDVRAKTLRQVVTAVGDGAVAANSVIEYLK